MFGRRDRRQIDQRVKFAIANHSPNSIEIWRKSQDDLQRQIADRSLNHQAADKLEQICINYVAKTARIYIIDLMGSFKKSTSSIKDDFEESQDILVKFGVRWAMVDDAVSSIFVDAGFYKKFSMIDLLNDFSHSLGSESQKLVRGVWVNVGERRENYQYFMNDIPIFISKYDAIAFDLIEILSGLD